MQLQRFRDACAGSVSDSSFHNNELNMSVTSSEDNTGYQGNQLDAVMASQVRGYGEITTGQSPVRNKKKTKGEDKLQNHNGNQREAVIALRIKDTTKTGARRNSQSPGRKKRNRKTASVRQGRKKNKAGTSGYDKGTLEHAVELVRYHAYSLRAAAQETGVPKSTLADQVNRTNVEETADEEEPFLTRSREKMLVRYLEELAAIGYTHSNTGLAQLALDMAKYYQLQPDKKGKKIDKVSWAVGFQRRWPELADIKQMKLVKILPKVPVDWMKVFESKSGLPYIVPHLSEEQEVGNVHAESEPEMEVETDA